MIRELEFKLLCGRHADVVYRYARSILGSPADAEDATQEVLLRLWSNLPKVPFLQAKSWLLRTTRNYCLDQLRRRKTRTAPVLVSEEILAEIPDEREFRPGADLDRMDLESRLSRALMALPESLRSAFVLREINGMRYREIAATLDLPINTVKVHISRARQKLQRLVAKEELCPTP